LEHILKGVLPALNTPSIAALINQNHAKYIRRKNTDGFRLKYSLGHTERRALIKEVGIHALVLFEYYLRLASTENAMISDIDAGEYFDWSPHTAKRHRLSLARAGWIAIEKASLNNGRRVEVYYLGKEEVRASGIKPEAETPKKKAPAKPDMSLFELDSLK
jgi:hypothetical protein